MPIYRFMVYKWVYRILTLYTLRKLFKNPISERWGKQICLN